MTIRPAAPCCRLALLYIGHSQQQPQEWGTLPTFWLPLIMLAPSFYQRSTFPPVDDALTALQRIDWAALGDRCLSALMMTAAVIHALTVRLWAARGRLAPAARYLSAALAALADRLPEPLNSASPRAALIDALISADQPAAPLAKASRAALVARARRLALIA